MRAGHITSKHVGHLENTPFTRDLLCRAVADAILDLGTSKHVKCLLIAARAEQVAAGDPHTAPPHLGRRVRLSWR
jgi:hypothetical protein